MFHDKDFHKFKYVACNKYLRAVEFVGCGWLHVWWCFICIQVLLCVCGHLRRKTSVKWAVKSHVKSSLSTSSPCYSQSFPKVWWTPFECKYWSLIFGATTPSGPGPPYSRGLCRSHSGTHHSRQDCAGLVISLSQKQWKTHTTDRHPCPHWVSNPQSQQESRRRHMP